MTKTNAAAPPRPTILIVEPSPTMRSVYGAHCKGRGAAVEYVADVAEAIRFVTQRKPAAIITVDELEGMNGASLLAALKCSPAHRAIPVVLMTSNEVHPEQFGPYGPDHVVRKDGELRQSLEGFLDSVGLGVKGLVAGDGGTERLPEGTRILLAEDNMVNQTVVGRVLHVAGAEVVAVNNGAEAVASALREPFDLVLMDIQMPTLDGYEATRILRSSGKDLPIVALTGEDEESFRACSAHTAFDRVLFKPAGRAELLTCCQELLAAARSKTS
ncbi:MAG: response regulator [Planctomycetota bacterium]|nr:response regulator [Planctomycetota bacterium]